MTLEEIKPIINQLLTKKESGIFMEKLEKITKEEQVMSEAEALRLDDMLRRSIRKEGVEEGISKGKSLGIEETIKNMLKSNLSLNTISKITSKSICEIEKIKDKM